MTRYFSATESEARRRRSVRHQNNIGMLTKMIIYTITFPFVLLIWLVHRIFFKRKAS